MFLTISQNSQDSTSAGVSTYQFNSQSMGKISKFHRKPPVLEHGTVRSYFLIKLQQIRSFFFFFFFFFYSRIKLHVQL